MTRGRKPDPTRERRGTGNRRKAGDPAPAEQALDRVLSAVPDAPKQTWPDPPEYLPEADHGTWHRVMGELWPRGLRESDLSGVVMLVTAASEHREASEAIAQSGLVIRNDKGQPVANPYVKIRKDAAATYTRLADQFGLTIAARLRLGLIQLAGQSILQSLDSDISQAWEG